MKSFKKRLPLFLTIVVITAGVYFSINLYKTSRVNEILHEQAGLLELSYKQGLDRFNVIGENVYYSLQNDTKFIDILASTNETNLEENHNKLYEHLKSEYRKLKISGIMGIHIFSPKNISILRMHKLDKYGDDLTDIRPIVKAVNEQKIHMHGFEEGKSSHAFREVYPLYKDGTYIGLVEVLFSSTKLQDYTMRVSNIHTHFIVNKNVFKTNEWKINTSEPYEQSIEHKDFLFSMNDHINHATLKNSKQTLIKPLEEEILQNIESNESFSLYQIIENDAKILAFHAVQRFTDNKTVAYIVSYTSSKKLAKLVNNMYMLNIGFILLAIFTYIVVSRLLSEKEYVMNELKYDALTKVYNRKYFMNIAEKLFKQEEEFSIVMADIDFFKNVNDTHGHQYGDIVLKEFAKIIKDSLRSMDLVARYGGEEFIILLHTDNDNAYKIVEGIRRKIESYEFGDKGITLSASFGISEYNNENSLEAIIKKADTALYNAKTNGRNQTQTL